MVVDPEQSPFFKDRRAQGCIVVRELPKFDLESYISNYDGPTRILRLRHIGSHSPYLAVDAYRMAISQAKEGKNVQLYTDLVEQFNQIAPDDPLATKDDAWVEKKKQDVKAEGERLNHELRAYKNNLIQESIRMGNEDLGHFYAACGDHAEAVRAFNRMRDNCTSPKQIADMNLRLVVNYIAQSAWMAVQTSLIKLEAVGLRPEEKSKLDPVISACYGLSYMCTGNYLDAANSFINTSSSFMTMEPVGGVQWQREVISANDVAVYGGLCALASMDRNELQTNVLGDSNFRNFLELEPHIRRAITLFCNSKYSACLEVLEGYRTDYLLDMYLCDRLSVIYGKIRTKSIVQYFVPFSCVTLEEMASKFGTGDENASIEDELAKMISTGLLNARIDLVDGLLISPPTNLRHDVHSNALAMAEKYEHTLQLRLTRLNLLNAGMSIKPDKSKEGGPFTPGEGGYAAL
ncbi:PCI-domain-containing protein [Westerdykella ornata]|uniref:PCI-domain-containing protein n=1 Tax=Westerdykella ornata TaxID=318751 RepID=A0A6A6JRA0_WESOR|nr:PCI-domain-containing protein [Westerdykella ornata]KAF2279150.1 PCI-domain-containing protein [Westerdykella ornata]